MGAPRTAAVLIGLGLVAGSVLPAVADPGSLSALPSPPEVVVEVEAEPRAISDAASISRETAPSPDIGAAALPDIVLPDVPNAPVALTVADRTAGALAAHLADERRALHARLPRKDREAIAAFYALGDYRPVWIENGAWTAAARGVIDRLGLAHEEALDPGEYPVTAVAAPASPEGIAEADLRLSAAAVVYARDARGARLDPARLSDLMTPKLELPTGDAVLTRLAAAKDGAGAALQGFNPPHAGYQVLRAKLAEARTTRPDARLESDIIANMERWRWLPADLGARHVFVSVPEFRLTVVDRGHPVHQARVIVGRPETPTPVFSDEMDHVIVNPSWYVPPSIFKNEFYSDPDYAASRGYEVVRGRDGSISIRQPPGERNALGFIKFMFPNKHAVYLHDTPNRSLFGKERRALSHGCVRVDQPFELAEQILGKDWSETRLRGLIGKGERTIKLAEKLPVHLTYFTLVADENGELRSVTDLYGYHQKVRTALKLGGEATPVVAERASKPQPPRRKARRAPPPAVAPETADAGPAVLRWFWER